MLVEQAVGLVPHEAAGLQVQLIQDGADIPLDRQWLPEQVHNDAHLLLQLQHSMHNGRCSVLCARTRHHVQVLPVVPKVPKVPAMQRQLQTVLTAHVILEMCGAR